MELNVSLHPKQMRAFVSPATEILYGGAAGSGKSHLMRVAAIAWSMEIPGLQTYIFRREYAELYSNHMDGPNGFISLLDQWERAGKVKVNTGKNEIEFWNGSKVFLRHCQHEKDVKKYLGAEIHVLMIDELTTFTEPMYRFLRNRLRMAGITPPDHMKGMFPRIICGTNPGSVGHLWVKASFIDPEPSFKLWWTPRDEGGMLRQFIPASLDDNPSLNEVDPDYEKRLEGLGDVELVKAMRHGIWDIAQGAFFADVWKREKHVIPMIDNLNKLTGRFSRSFDWGSAHPGCVLWWWQANGDELVFRDGRTLNPPKGSWVAIGEHYTWNGKPNQGSRESSEVTAKRILELEAMWGIKGRMASENPADHNIFGVVDGRSMNETYAALGVRWTKAAKGPGSRVSGFQLMRDMLMESAKDYPEKPGLYISENCTHLIRTLPAVPRNENKWDEIDTNAEDHAVDCAIYRLTAEIRQATTKAFALY